MTRLAFFLSLVFAGSAYAGWFGSSSNWKSDDCPKKHSLAWCLADFQGRSEGLVDMSQEEFLKFLQKSGIGNPNDGTDYVGKGLSAGIGIGSYMLGNMLNAGAFTMNAILPGRDYVNQVQFYFVILDDQNTSLTDEQLNANYTDAIHHAIDAAFATLPPEVKITNRADNIYRVLPPGDNCEKRFSCELAYEKTIRIERKQTPAYMGGSAVVTPLASTLSGIVLVPPPSVNAVAFAKTISENLPAWYYWYIPAGKLGTNPFPMFMNQGQPLFFVKPGQDATDVVLPHVASRAKQHQDPVGDATPTIVSSPAGSEN